MSGNNWLSLIPIAHRVAIISPFVSSDEAAIPALQKTRRSSSTATTDSNAASEEPTLPSDNVEDSEIVPPTEEVDVQVDTVELRTPVSYGHTFLRLGN